MINIKNKNLLNTAMRLLQEHRLEYLGSALNSNEKYAKSSKKITEAFNTLPDKYFKIVFDIDGAYTEQLAITQEVMYKQGFQDGISLLLELINENYIA